ncbi:hypothetical protein CVD28_01005 [Bacillus sp. M6-12]|uniref:hypothetical protein n=1 Tax=Bacillus sp. M6-12 TaxID=2054166 RepID=UPI000C789ACD|nr:hypothetical protein [Bacillus sp. M6-12]PLS19012.1 hypothetical protein CVD28_01005 [Bacillus sp. M6-12]
MKSINMNEVKKEFQSTQRYFNGWNPDTMQPMEKDMDKYFELKNEITQKYCTDKISQSEQGIILYAEEHYDEITIWDETFHIGDEIRSYWLSGDMEGTIESIKVYFSTVSWELEWEMEIKTRFNDNMKVQKQNSPHLLSTLQHA